MSNEVFLIGMVITGIASAIIGGLVGTVITLSRVTAVIETLRQDKPWEQAVEALFRSVPATLQQPIQAGAQLLNSVDGLVQDIVNPVSPTSANGAPFAGSPAPTNIFAPSPIPPNIVDLPPSLIGQIAKTTIDAQAADKAAG